MPEQIENRMVLESSRGGNEATVKCTECEEPICEPYYDFGDGPVCEYCVRDYINKHYRAVVRL